MSYIKGDAVFFMSGDLKIEGIIIDYCEDTDKYYIGVNYDKNFLGPSKIYKIRTHRIKPIYEF